VTRFTYQHLLDLVEGDSELIVRMLDEGLVDRTGDIVSLDIDHVLIARTLWRELEVEWPGIEIALKLMDELRAARARIAELEAQLAAKP
jgi:hypothetical protein